MGFERELGELLRGHRDVREDATRESLIGDKRAYDERAAKLVAEFSTHFDKIYRDKGIDEAVIAQCPGK